MQNVNPLKALHLIEYGVPQCAIVELRVSGICEDAAARKLEEKLKNGDEKDRHDHVARVL